MSVFPVAGLVEGLVAGLLAVPVEGLVDEPVDGLAVEPVEGLVDVPVDGLVEGFEAEGLETAPVDGFVEVPVEGFAAAGLSTVVLGLTLVFFDGFSAGFLIGFEGLATVDFLLLSFDDGLVCEPDVVLLG